jgi:hypothetical protein
MSGIHRMRQAPCSAPRSGSAIRLDEVDTVDVSGLVSPFPQHFEIVRRRTDARARIVRDQVLPWKKSDSGSVGRRMTCCDRERASAMLASATVRSFECAIGLSTKRLASWYCAPRRGSRALRLRRRLVGCIESARGTHGRGGRRDRAVDNYVYNMSTRCAHVRRSEASIAF